MPIAAASGRDSDELDANTIANVCKLLRGSGGLRCGRDLGGGRIFRLSQRLLPDHRAAHPVDTGLLSFNNTHVWQQTVTLGSPQALPAGQYMISIGVSGYVDNQGSIWFWNTSNQGDGFLAYDAYDGAGWRQFTQQPTDVSFELLAVPEPTTEMMAVIGGVVALSWRRRQRQRQRRAC